MLSKRTRIQLSAKSLSVIVVLTCSGLVMAAEPQPSAAAQPVAPTAATQPAGQPAIKVDAAEHDFGSVRSGEKVEHRVRITNTGTAELKITNVKTNSGCTVAGDCLRAGQIEGGRSGYDLPVLFLFVHFRVFCGH